MPSCPMKVCLHLYNGICFQVEQCSFAHSSLELHPNADFSQLELAWELDDDASEESGVRRCGRCTRWQTAGGPGRYTNTGHGMGRVALAGTPGVRERSGLLGHCWHLASPRRVSGSQVVVRVLMLAWIFAFVVFCALAAPVAVVMVAESGFFNVLASVRELAALTAGFFGCVLCILVAAVLSWVGRAGGLGSLSPFVGAVKAAGLFASVRQF